MYYIHYIILCLIFILYYYFKVKNKYYKIGNIDTIDKLFKYINNDIYKIYYTKKLENDILKLCLKNKYNMRNLELIREADIRYLNKEDKLFATLYPKKYKTSVLMFNKYKNNLGCIIRTGSAFGFQNYYTPSEMSKSELKAVQYFSMGHHVLSKFTTCNYKYLIENLKKKGFKIICIEINDKSKCYYKSNLSYEKILFILGEENSGIPKDVIKMCDFSIYIPIITNSINVSCAFSVIGSERNKQINIC